MAWIEDQRGDWINLDNAQGVQVWHELHGPTIRVAMYSDFADICECKDTPTARKVQKQIVGLARGNLLITQEDVRRMIDGQTDSD